MPKTKNERALEAIMGVVRPLLKAVLAESIQDHYSEAQWDEIVAKVGLHLGPYLARNHDLNAILNEGDMLDSRGNVNAAGVISGLEHMAGQAVKPGSKDRLTHLANHMKMIFTELRLLKGGDRDG